MLGIEHKKVKFISSQFSYNNPVRDVVSQTRMVAVPEVRWQSGQSQLDSLMV